MQTIIPKIRKFNRGILSFVQFFYPSPADVGRGFLVNKNKEKSMNNKTAEHNPGASDSARLFCTQISSASSDAGEFKKHRKEPNMANKENTTLGIGNENPPFKILTATITQSQQSIPRASSTIPTTHLPERRAIENHRRNTRKLSILTNYNT